MTATYNENNPVALNKTIRLTGGYPDCSLSSQPSGRSTLQRQGDGLVLDILYAATVDAPTRQVAVENFVITGGGGSGSLTGGAIVEGRPGRLIVDFRNVEFSNNSSASNGGGLRISTTGDRSGTSTFVTLDNDTIFSQNNAAGDGGGIYCQSNHDNGLGTLLRLGTTLVINNQADNGGGIALNGCTQTFIYAGGPIVLFIPTGGIVLNTAASNGGGLFMENGARAVLSSGEFQEFGDAAEAALVAGNTAGGAGGGVSIFGEDVSLTMLDAYVINNTADAWGGGASVDLGAEMDIERPTLAGACESPVSAGLVLRRPPCSVFEGNEATTGGALSVRGNSRLWVSRTSLRNNTISGTLGAAASIANSSLYTGPPTEFRMEGSVVHENTGGYLFSLQQNAAAEISFSTIVDNPVTLAVLGAFSGGRTDLDIRSSIVVSNTWIIEGNDDGNLSSTIDCVIGNKPFGDTGASNSFAYSNIDPQFINQAENNYQLQQTSPAIDYCSDFYPPEFPDLDGNQRGVTWAGPAPDPAPNPGNGDYDLGAFEAQPDRIFNDRFETTP